MVFTMSHSFLNTRVCRAILSSVTDTLMVRVTTGVTWSNCVAYGVGVAGAGDGVGVSSKITAGRDVGAGVDDAVGSDVGVTAVMRSRGVTRTTDVDLARNPLSRPNAANAVRQSAPRQANTTPTATISGNLRLGAGGVSA